MNPVLNLKDCPAPPETLAFGDVQLLFVQLDPGNPARGFVPVYQFRILLQNGPDVGHLNFRMGDTDHVKICAGHIGYGIQPPFRGQGYAGQACRAVAPFVREFYHEVIITCDPDNAASRRTIEKLGASFIDEVPVPADDPHYARGSRSKLRYRWEP